MKNRETWRSASTSDRIVAVSTSAMAILTVFLAVLAGMQWHEIHTGATDTHDLAVAAKSQADNTSKLADAAQKQASAAASQVQELREQVDRQDKILQKAQEQTEATNRLVAQSARSADSAREEVRIARSEQRPWMVFALSADKPVAGAKFKVTAVAQNSGKSPAYVLRSLTAVINTSLDPSVFTETPPGGFSALIRGGSQTVVTPGNNYDAGSEPFDNLQLASNELIQTGTEKWYIFGYLTYKDLDTLKLYKSRSCIYWDVTSNAWKACHGFDFAE